jgi:hypothetical protein
MFLLKTRFEITLVFCHFVIKYCLVVLVFVMLKRKICLSI